MSEEETSLLEPFREKAEKGQIIEISEIKASEEFIVVSKKSKKK